jgi:hypothetical protein
MMLQGKGITSISCGGFHTAALAASLGPEGGDTTVNPFPFSHPR